MHHASLRKAVSVLSPISHSTVAEILHIIETHGTLVVDVVIETNEEDDDCELDGENQDLKYIDARLNLQVFGSSV